MTKESKNTRVERSWIMYDWANSAYATIILAAIFPIYFATIAPDADVWWGVGTSIATLIGALTSPFLGAIADYSGMKMKCFLISLIGGVVFTSLMAVFNNWVLLLAGYVLSSIGFSASCLFYDSFLTDVTTPERMDTVSARGYAMGYIGGSTIPFVIAIILNMTMENASLAVKLSIVLTSVWWLVFSIPFLLHVKQQHSLGEVPKNIIGSAMSNVVKTFKEISKDKGMLLYVFAYFFYIDGVNTVIAMSTAYGTTLGLGTIGMIIALLVTQLIAAPASILFSKISEKIGAVKMISFAVVVYFIVCVVGFYMGFSLEPSQMDAEQLFTERYIYASGEYYDEFYDIYTEGFSVLNSASRKTELDEILVSFAVGNAGNYDESTFQDISKELLLVMDAISLDGNYDHALRRSNILFWLMAGLVGTCQAGIQSLSRSFFGRLVPPEKSNEYFGFFDIFCKFAAVIGPALYALTKELTGRSSYGILSLMLLFALGFILLQLRSRYLKVNGITEVF